MAKQQYIPQHPPRNAHRSGVVIVIMLLAMLLLLGFVLYVHNIGKQTAARIETQNAADAAAISAAGSLARSFNTVAQNNVAISRLIAQTIVIDAMPRAINDTYDDQSALISAVEEHYNNLSSNNANDKYWILQNTLTDMLGYTSHGFGKNLEDEVRWLRELNDTLNGSTGIPQSIDVTDLTTYPYGQFWLAMTTLSDFSKTTIEHADELAILAGEQAAYANLRDEPKVAVVRQKSPLPYVTGSFNDFEDPVTQGLLPPQIDRRNGPDQPGYPQFRGPFDTIYGWRSYNADAGQQSTTSFPNPPVNSNTSNTNTPIIYRYITLGPLQRMLHDSLYLRQNVIPYSRYEQIIRPLVYQKVDMIWPDAHIGAYYLHAPRPVRENLWDTQFPPQNPNRVTETMFLVLEIKSDVSADVLESQNIKPTQWEFVKRREQNQVVPYIYRANDWVDPRLSNDPTIPSNLLPTRTNGQWKRLGSNNIWRFEEKISDPLSYYWISYYVFIATNYATNEDARNPFQGLRPNSDDTPHPVFFRPFNEQDDIFWDSDSNQPALPVQDEILPQTAYQNYYDSKRQYLTFFAAVSQNDQTFSQRFREKLPENSMIAAISQAHVFNNHSFDLWTQMWRSQLELISNSPDEYAAWLDAMPSNADSDSLKNYLEIQVQDLLPMIRH